MVSYSVPLQQWSESFSRVCALQPAPMRRALAVGRSAPHGDEMFALARPGKMPARSSCSQDDGTVGLYISSYIVLQYIVLQTGASTSWGLVGAVERLDVGLIS
jgi:hypothetical protein